ncbi:MAG TPA: bifunctional 4-hydroxy-2-oxoglutarate aldolase/2-dehydro-3-deoxy-phosphogluconate aldolase [Treponemataceae bacterium]|nr:bifunctional 4-hydroxy-2-oxoglutarate aldolase/2-dehydro-3-deoxy-phosphogluconate aldolase [Treponemataceae bacterium]
MESILSEIETVGIVPVIKIDDPLKAVPLARALFQGGMTCVEITFRTTAAAEAIKRISQAVPEIAVGAGTVLSVENAQSALEAGARFAVAPGCNPRVVSWCQEHGLPFIPGVNTPTAIELALEKGITHLKFFPAEASGGVAMLQALSGPFPGVRFMPTGGISLENIPSYAKCSNVFALGGSWMVNQDLIDKEDWDEIRRRSLQAVTAMQGFSLAHLGINCKDTDEAKETSAFFSLLGFVPKDGEKSIFNGTAIEVMKSPFLGSMGHIALSCWNIERSLAWLKRHGFSALMETARYDRGQLSVVYLDREIGGFACHLVRSR